MFALASRYFGLVSETFVTAHAMRLAPGRSAFVTHTEAPIPAFNGPFLCDIGQRPRAYEADGTPRSPRPALPLGKVKPLRDRAVANEFDARVLHACKHRDSKSFDVATETTR